MYDPDLTLLLVEDNDVDVMVVQRLLRRLSIELPIVRASNGEEALALLRAPTAPPRPVPPFVIVLDLNMPRMTGLEFLAEIADDARLADVPVFILSTSTDSRDRRMAKEYRIRGYFVKPIGEPELAEVLGSTGACEDDSAA